MAAEDIKLNIGAGRLDKRSEGYLNVDMVDYPTIDIVCNTLHLTKLFHDVDKVYARHTLEHLKFSEFPLALKEIHTILKAGGTFNIIVPDLEFHIKQLQDIENLDKLSELGNNTSNYTHAISSVYGWQSHNEDFHYNGFTEYILRRFLKENGFDDIERQDDKLWNLNLICKK